MSKIIEIQDNISNENKIAYLMGDYNINLLKFVTQKKNYFIYNVISQGFIPYITKPVINGLPVPYPIENSTLKYTNVSLLRKT